MRLNSGLTFETRKRNPFVIGRYVTLRAIKAIIQMRKVCKPVAESMFYGFYEITLKHK